MPEPPKTTQAPSPMGGYGQGTKSSTRSRIEKRSAKNPGAPRRSVVPQNPIPGKKRPR